MRDVFNANIAHAYYIPSVGFSSEETFSAAIKKVFPGAVEYDFKSAYNQPHIKDLQTAQRFLHGGAQTYGVKRFFLEDLRPDTEKAGFCGWCAMLAFFPESGVLSLSFHYGLENTTTDRLIVLRQSGIVRKYPFTDGEFSCRDLAENICGQIGIDFKPAEQSFLCEITKFGEYEDIALIEKEQANRLYGLLTGDEAYEFVPDEIVKSRLGCSWGSRSFIKIFAFGQAFLFLNLIGSPRQTEYLAHQEKFGTAAYGGCDEYFKMGSCPIIANHGILFSVEFVMMLKALIDNVITYQSEYDKEDGGSFYHRIRAIRAFRKKIIIVLEKAENTAISEIGELSSILLESQHIAPIVDRVKYLLEILEGDLDLIYSERNNILVTILTIIGLVFAAVQIIIPFFPI